MVRPSTAIVVHESEGGDRSLEEPIVFTRGQQEPIEDPAVYASSAQRHQQIFVHKEIVFSNQGVVEELDRVLQDSQVRNDEKLLEIAQYTHDHVINTAAHTEKRLGGHIHDYFDGVHAQYEALSKQQVECQAAEIDRRFNCIVQDLREHTKASAVDAVGSLASDLGNQISGALSTMETAINSHNTTHASVCEDRLELALQKVQDDFEAAADLQSEWIEKRLNAKLDAAKQAAEIERQTNLRACEILFEEQEKRIGCQTAEIGQSHANEIDERLQQKIDDAMKAFQLKTQQHVDARIVEAVTQFEQSQQAIQGQFVTAIATSTTTLEEKFQSQLHASQTATGVYRTRTSGPTESCCRE